MSATAVAPRNRAPASKNSIEQCAYESWKAMQSQAKRLGLALTKDKRFGDGRVWVGTVGAVIKALSKERDWGLAESEVSEVRAYLKATGNVVVLEKVEQYRFRIFVREEWSDTLLAPERDSNRVGPSSEEKVTPEQAGETREPAPVTYKCADCDAKFENQNSFAGHRAHCKARKGRLAAAQQPQEQSRRIETLGSDQLATMEALAEAGGTIASSRGDTSPVIAEQAGLVVTAVSRTTRTLARRGLVERDVQGKRTYKVSLTDAGWEALDDPKWRPSKSVLESYLQRVGAVTARAGQLPQAVAEGSGISRARTAVALRTLEAEGKVMLTRTEGGNLTSVAWTAPEQAEAVIRHPRKPEPVPEPGPQLEAPSKGDVMVHQATPTRLLQELALRLDAVRGLDACRQRLDLIAELVQEVNDGTLAPLKALADIEAALDL